VDSTNVWWEREWVTGRRGKVMQKGSSLKQRGSAHCLCHRCFLWRSGRETSVIQSSTCTFIQTTFTRNYAWIQMSGPKRRPEKSENFSQLKPRPNPESPVAGSNFGEILKSRSVSLIHNLCRIATKIINCFCRFTESFVAQPELYCLTCD